MTHYEQFADFIHKVVKIRIVKLSYIDELENEYGHQYAIMAECNGQICMSERYGSLKAIEPGLKAYGGFIGFLYKTAIGRLDEEDLIELSRAQKFDPGLGRNTCIKVVKNMVGEYWAREKERDFKHNPSYDQVMHDMYGHDIPPSYRERG